MSTITGVLIGHWLTVGTPVPFIKTNQPAIVYYTIWKSQIDARLFKEGFDPSGVNFDSNFALIRLTAHDDRIRDEFSVKVRLNEDVERTASYTVGSMFSDDGRTTMISDREYQIQIDDLPTDGYYQVAFMGDKNISISDISTRSPDVRLINTDTPPERVGFFDVLIFSLAMIGSGLLTYLALKTSAQLLNLRRKDA
ncbi:hypothetical protein AAG602_07035 [Citromicrobium bathyomarinum]